MSPGWHPNSQVIPNLPLSYVKQKDSCRSANNYAWIIMIMSLDETGKKIIKSMKNRWRCKCKCIKRDTILIQFPKIMRQCHLVSFFLQRQKNKQSRKLNTFVLYSMLIIIMLRAVKIVYDSHFLCAQMLPVLHLFSAISLYWKQKRQRHFYFCTIAQLCLVLLVLFIDFTRSLAV